MSKSTAWEKLQKRALSFRSDVDALIGDIPGWLPAQFRSQVGIGRFRVLFDLARGHYSIADFERALSRESRQKVIGDNVIVSLRLPRNPYLRSRTDELQLFRDLRRARDRGAEQGLKVLLGTALAGDARVGRLQRDRGKEGGKVSGQRRRANSARVAVVRAARLWLTSGNTRRGMAAQLRTSGVNLSIRQINRILREENIG